MNDVSRQRQNIGYRLAHMFSGIDVKKSFRSTVDMGNDAFFIGNDHTITGILEYVAVSNRIIHPAYLAFGGRP
jgi:hypothetical protein